MGVKFQAVNTTYLVLGAAGLVVAWYLYNESKKAAIAVAEAVNPLSHDNVFYTGVNAVGEAVTGEKEFSLGSWIYDKLHPNEFEGEFN